MENMGNESKYEPMPQDKAELLMRIQREWAALERVTEQVNQDQMTVPDTGGWSIKDNLAHLAVWERFLRLYHLRNLPPHEVLEIDDEALKEVDEDGLNAILFERNKDRSVADVLTELRRSHEQVLADLEQISFADLMKPRYADDPEARPLMEWVTGNTYEHYQEHRAAIERLIEQVKK